MCTCLDQCHPDGPKELDVLPPHHAPAQPLTPFIFWNCPMALCMLDNLWRGTGGTIRCHNRAPRFIRHSQSTAMMRWFAENKVKCMHIERVGLISNISRFSHPSQILVFSRVCFHAINRMEAIYLCSFGVTEVQKNQNINIKRS